MISKPDLDRLRRIKGKAGDGRIAEAGANLVLDVVFVALLSGGIEGGCGRNSGNTALLGIGLLWCIPIRKKILNRIDRREPVSNGLKIAATWVGMIPGLLLLVNEDI